MTSDEEEQLAPRWRKHLKSGLHRTGATTVLNKVIWPHEVVYTLADKPPAYQDILIPLFVQGYLIVMDSKTVPVRHKMGTHLKDLMSDSQLYVWDLARTFHGVWPNQLA